MPHTLDAINEIELKAVNADFNDLMSLLSNLNDEDQKNIERAFEIAVDAHRHQRRKSGEPYIHHPIAVAKICAQEIGLGPTAIICALLHDVVEDTDVTLKELIDEFGEKIGKIVDGLTKLDGLYNVESPQAENLKKVLGTLTYDVRVALIKMADRVHNLRTIGSMPQYKQLKIAAETSFIYAPLAHRLGLYKIKTEFEDRCMAISDKEFYDGLQQKVQDSESERQNYIKDFIAPLKEGIDELEIDYKVIGRPKSIASIANKIKTKKVEFEEIYDLFAVRIIVDVPTKKEKSICWQVYSVITDVFKPIPERLKDWVTTPKSNGYESLHTTVIGPGGRFVEVQIRSRRMDEIAEKGFAAHWKYKGVKGQDNIYDTWLDSIREILDAQHNSAVEFLNDFKSNLFKEEVYVFTPNGDMKILPKGSTALDFAFAVHSDVGYKATAIKVNNKLVPMGHVLNNGDQLKVTTNKSQKPSENWLKMVVTGKAKSKIRSAMKEERKKRGELGKEALQRKMRNLKVDFEDNVDFLVKEFGFQSRADLYFSLANEDTKVSDLKRFDIVDHKFELPKEKEITTPIIPSKEAINRPRKAKINEDQKNLILVNGEPASMYEFSLSTCCNPVPGDEIFGFLSTAAGLKIHRTICPNAQHLMSHYGYRMLDAEWAGATKQNFAVEIRITGVDSGIGVIQNLTNEISTNLGLNIRSFSISGDEGYYEGKVSLIVKNKNQLSLVINTIKKIEGIDTVERIQ